jgi:hypothetical protein
MSRSIRTPRYPPDMSDAECAVTEPTLPGPAWKRGRGGRPAQRCRCTVRDYERLTAHHETMLHRAMIIVMTRRLARHPARPGIRHPGPYREGRMEPGKCI